jgi:signal transduction histidine kinase
MEGDMACKNIPTEFPERVHKGFLQRGRGTSSGWHAFLQQTRHRENLRSARELRHALLRTLFSDSMQFCLVNERLPADSPTRPILRRPLDLLRKAFDRGRGDLQGLRFPALPAGSLEKALGDVCDDFSPGSRSRLRMIIVGQTRPLVPAVQEQVYWIAREALLNAVQHSAASRIEAEIEYSPHKLRVVVRDDGRGIDQNTLGTGRSGPRGLSSMQERAASIGAKVRVWSRQGGGTEVEISLPIPGKPA